MSDLTTVGQENGLASGKAYGRRAVAPPLDVFENADELLLIADVPGVHDDGIDLRFENDTLTLVGKQPVPKETHPALAREYDEVDFALTFRVPAGIDAAAISAETRSGTLIVRLPKAAATKPRKIVVK
jgi:HSP20 family molecular chaperone IbpA